MPTECGKGVSPRCQTFYFYFNVWSVFKRRDEKLEIRISLNGKTIKMRRQPLPRETEREAESTEGEPRALGNAESFDVSIIASRRRTQEVARAYSESLGGRSAPLPKQS
jgi:hypothetical protein